MTHLLARAVICFSSSGVLGAKACERLVWYAPKTTSSARATINRCITGRAELGAPKFLGEWLQVWGSFFDPLVCLTIVTRCVCTPLFRWFFLTHPNAENNSKAGEVSSAELVRNLAGILLGANLPAQQIEPPISKPVRAYPHAYT